MQSAASASITYRFRVLSHWSRRIAVTITESAIIELPMKARVFVSLKSTVLDPQDQTIRAALNGLGYASIAEVRQGKFFDIALAGGVTHEQAKQDLEAIAHEVLANPVIEEYQVEIL